MVVQSAVLPRSDKLRWVLPLHPVHQRGILQVTVTYKLRWPIMELSVPRSDTFHIWLLWTVFLASAVRGYDGQPHHLRTENGRERLGQSSQCSTSER